MRIRQVKPEFWKDDKVAALSPQTRLTFIGLWMLSDDAGYFRHDVTSIAFELYGWDTRRARREKHVAESLAELKRTERIAVLECGHGIVLHLKDHQRFGGETKRVFTVKREHDGCPRSLPRIPAGPPESPSLPDPVIGNGTERKGTERLGSAREREDDEEPTEFQRRVPRPVIA